MQENLNVPAAAMKTAKDDIQKSLDKLNDELNANLAGEYGIPVEKRKEYDKWLNSHKPFHWFTEFYGIISNGGFDVIIGNPPYVEYSKVKNEYSIQGYKTEECGNLYTFVIERLFPVLEEQGRFGMIVPISLACSDRMSVARRMIYENCSNIWVSNFAIRPQPLFAGIMQRNSIILTQASQTQNISVWSTNYLRWNATERDYLFARLSFANVMIPCAQDDIIPKVATSMGIRILKAIAETSAIRIGLLTGATPAILYFHDSGESYWTKTLWDEPVAYRNGVRVAAAQWFDLVLPDEFKPFTYLLLNSNLFYLLWTAYTDCRHMTKGFIQSVMLPCNREDTKPLVQELRQAYEANTKLFEKRSGYKSPEIIVHNFKHIIDKIDKVLAKHYGFTEEELDFIINYDIKYRMGRDAEEV